MEAEYRRAITLAITKRWFAWIVIVLTFLIPLVILFHGILKFTIYLSLLSSDFSWTKDSWILDLIIWMIIVWLSLLFQSFRLFLLSTHDMKVEVKNIGFFSSILITSIAMIYLVSFVLSYASHITIYSSVTILTILSLFIVYQQYNKYSIRNLTDTNIRIDYLSLLPLSIFKSLKRYFYQAIIISIQVGIISGIITVILSNILSILLPTILGFHLPIIPNMILSLSMSTMIVMIWQFMKDSFHLIVTYPLDFTKLSSFKSTSNVNDMISTAILSGAFKSSSKLLSILPSSNISKANLHDLILGSDFSQPLWYRLQLCHREASDKLLDSISKSERGRPIISMLSTNLLSWSNYHEDLIRRLAYQDFTRLVKGSYSRRKNLFFDKKWMEIGYSLCSFLDAVVLQIQLDCFFMMVEIINPIEYTDTKEPITPTSSLSLSSYDSKFSSIITNSIIQFARSIPIEIIKERKTYRETKSNFGYVIKTVRNYICSINPKTMKSWGNTNIDWLLQSLEGIEAIFDPISLSTTQDVIHTIEILSIALTTARKEDPFGLTQQYLPSVLYSLIGLELSLMEYGKVIRKVFSIQRNRYIHQYRKQKAMSGSYVSQNIQALVISVDEGLNRIVRAYYDIIPRYPLPSIYTEALNKRLKPFPVVSSSNNNKMNGKK